MEAMYCMSGTGKVRINGEEHDFFPGAMIVAPPTVSHKIMNTGTEMLRVFCVFSPPVTGASLRQRAMEAVKAHEEAEKKGK
jgi:mannose-6-phosphate isomerase-like protein (cupin superfamily)